VRHALRLKKEFLYLRLFTVRHEMRLKQQLSFERRA